MSNLSSIRQALIDILTQENADNIDWNNVRVLAEEAEAEENAQFETLSQAKPFYHRCVVGGASFLLVHELVVDGTITKEDVVQWAWAQTVSDTGTDMTNAKAFGFNDISMFSKFLQTVALYAQQIAYIANQVANGNTMWRI